MYLMLIKTKSSAAEQIHRHGCGTSLLLQSLWLFFPWVLRFTCNIRAILGIVTVTNVVQPFEKKIVDDGSAESHGD